MRVIRDVPATWTIGLVLRFRATRLWAVGIAVALAVAAVTSVGLWAATHDTGGAPGASIRLSTVQVRLGTIVNKVDSGATLQGAPVPLAALAQQPGTVTSVAPAGSKIAAGDVLYVIDDQPTVLLYGSIPAWESFSPGMASGPDVEELQQNLIALGYGVGIVANGEYSYQTEAAVEVFTKAVGLPKGDQLALGSVLFEPGAVIVSAAKVLPGTLVNSGSAIVDLQLDSPRVVATASNTSGIVIGTTALVKTSTSSVPLQGTVSSVTAAANSQNAVVITLITPPADLSLADTAVFVQFDVQVVRNAYIVPVAALIATVGGGYALQPAGDHNDQNLIAVKVGVVDAIDGLAQVTGARLRQGLRVSEAQ